MPGFQSIVPAKRGLDGGTEPAMKRHNSGSFEQYWMVQWRFPQTRKHKTWNGDGILQICGTSATLFDSDSSRLGTGKVEPPFCEGVGFQSIGGRDIELERSIPKSEFLSGQCFGPSGVEIVATSSSSLSSHHQPTTKQYLPPKPVSETRTFVPLQPVSLLASDRVSNKSTTSNPSELTKDSHWVVNWRKTDHSNKNRPWDGDAYLSCVGGKRLSLISQKGKLLGSTEFRGNQKKPHEPGDLLVISRYEVQLDYQVPSSRLPSNTTACSEDDEVEIIQPGPAKAAENSFVSPASFYAPPPKPKRVEPLHDPNSEGAVVMKSPPKDHVKRFNPRNNPIVPVVIQPSLARNLRPHQIEGVKFLYESVMGLGKHEGQGCILADDMGLGKTLQTITLIWTLLRQNPYGNCGPVVKKVLIACPVSLVNNWRAEFHKWIGKDRCQLAVCDKDKIDNIIAGFMNSKNIPILIIGYERLRTVINKLAVMVPPVGLIVCDEGHRLKSAANKTNQMFSALKTPRRIILSGTPIQNDLSELHTMAEFCNPGLLDDYTIFKRIYETPILKSRAPESTQKEVKLGEARSEQLSMITKSFVLRREAKLLNNYLPPKHEYIVFVKPTTLQQEIFRTLLNPRSMSVEVLSSSSTAESLAMINLLTKVSNDPILLQAMIAKGQDETSFRYEATREAADLIPDTAQIEDVNLSGKLMALSKLLKVIRRTTDEKCVIVSHFTSTLNILEAYCEKKKYPYYRLDGQTPTVKRQEYVNDFNRSSQDKGFIFLLSSKAGGVGINLIGGSRLCLIDCDWNPSHDLQSMARCHRDGQKRPVHIYRFLTSGSIDEKIYQRQVTKLGLSNSLIGSDKSGSKSDSFTKKELKDIFTVLPNTSCNTHDLLECPCSDSHSDKPRRAAQEGDDVEEEEISSDRGFKSASKVTSRDITPSDKAFLQKKKAELASLSEWRHIDCLNPNCWNEIEDNVLRYLLHWKEDPTNIPSGSNHNLSLMDAVDSGMKTMVRVPFGNLRGGAVGFIFQKSTTMKSTSSEQPLKNDQESMDESQ